MQCSNYPSSTVTTAAEKHCYTVVADRIFNYLGSIEAVTAELFIVFVVVFVCSKKNLSASRRSEHPRVRGKNVKTFRWDHRLQRPNLFSLTDWVPTTAELSTTPRIFTRFANPMRGKLFELSSQ